MNHLQPKDLIALAVLIGIGILKLKGMNGQLDAIAALILGYYFAHRQDGKDNGL